MKISLCPILRCICSRRTRLLAYKPISLHLFVYVYQKNVEYPTLVQILRSLSRTDLTDLQPLSLEFVFSNACNMSLQSQQNLLRQLQLQCYSIAGTLQKCSQATTCLQAADQRVEDAADLDRCFGLFTTAYGSFY